MSETTQAQINGEVRELLNMLEARKQLDAGFKGMGYNILQEKAMRLTSQIRRVERLLDNPPPSSPTVEQPSRSPAVEDAKINALIAATNLRSAYLGDNVSARQHAESVHVQALDALIAAVRAESQQKIEQADARAELHAKINRDVSDALGQNIGESWHDLGAKVAALRVKAEQDTKIKELTKELHNVDR
jgi:hypothetical protein